jgi:hypothetical protein
VALLNVEVESGPRLTKVALMGLLMDNVEDIMISLDVTLPGIELRRELGLTKLPLRLNNV